MVMGDITRIDTVQQYCDLFEVEALHPLVSVVNCYEVQPIRHSKKLYNIYAVLLKDTDCGTMNYGRSLYDYEKGSMLFIAPGQVMGSDDDGSLHQPAGWALMFHPELLRGTSLAHIIKEYSYFSYNANEALHLSEQERKVVIECINNVAEELIHFVILQVHMTEITVFLIIDSGHIRRLIRKNRINFRLIFLTVINFVERSAYR